MTKQHIFGKRLLNLLEGDLGTHFVIERNPGQKTTAKKRDGNIWSKQMRRVCCTCNGDWMRELEESTFELLSSLILGATIVSAFSQQALSARLAQMVTVASLSVPNGLDPISREDREYLRINKSTPARWAIFLARTDIPVNKGQFYYADVMGLTEFMPNGELETGKSYVVTFVLGKLCVHLLTRSPIGYEGYIGEKLSRLWPLPGRDIDLALAANSQTG
jgi:hypothetical protein